MFACLLTILAVWEKCCSLCIWRKLWTPCDESSEHENYNFLMTIPLRGALLYIYIKLEVLIVLWLRIHIFWDMTLCCGRSSSQSLEGSYCFHFQASSSPGIKSSTFFALTSFPHNTPFRRKYVGQTSILAFVCCTIWSMGRQAYCTDKYRAVDKEKLQYLKKQLCHLSTTDHKLSIQGLKLGLGSEKQALADLSWLGPITCNIDHCQTKKSTRHGQPYFSILQCFQDIWRFSLRFCCCRHSLIKVSCIFNVIHFLCNYIAYTEFNTELHKVFYLLINAPRSFGLCCWPSSGSSYILLTLLALCFNLYIRNSTYY